MFWKWELWRADLHKARKTLTKIVKFYRTLESITFTAIWGTFHSRNVLSLSNSTGICSSMIWLFPSSFPFSEVALRHRSQYICQQKEGKSMFGAPWKGSSQSIVALVSWRSSIHRMLLVSDLTWSPLCRKIPNLGGVVKSISDKCLTSTAAWGSDTS